MKYPIVITSAISLMLHGGVFFFLAPSPRSYQPQVGIQTLMVNLQHRDEPRLRQTIILKGGEFSNPLPDKFELPKSPAEASPTEPIKPLLDVDPTYYPAAELDQLAQPLNAVQLVPPEEGLQPARHQLVGVMRIQIKINESGVVDAVEVLSANPPEMDQQQVINAFKQTRFTPAMRSSRYVRSMKEVEVCYGPCSVPLESLSELNHP
ncbi:energy transducer TonB [Burkholderiaceae bacterium DAT-1]|nr:energy transducer TonB [Burkholderiaceae bacterium DAT-1]